MNSINRGLTLIGGAALGAGLMYLLDPDMGRRRRTLIRDKMIRTSNVTGRTTGRSQQDLMNRARGIVAETQSRLRRDKTAPDPVIAARVRSELGHAVSHPRAITVTSNDGYVTLSGPILANEIAPLLARVSYVRGVRGVENHLSVYARADGVPGLQPA